MVFELGPMARSCTINLFTLELLSLLIKIRQGQDKEMEDLSEITIYMKSLMTAHALERFDAQRSEKYLYIVTHTKHDAIYIEHTLHCLGKDLLHLQNILQTLNSKFLHPSWIGQRLDLFTSDISDILLTATCMPSRGKHREIFRGKTAWIES